MRSPLLACLALVVCASALGAAGCGGGDGGGGERLSKADFVSQANTICRDANKEAEGLKPDLPSDFDPTSESVTDDQLDTFGDYIEEITGIFRDQVDELRGLKPPEDFQDDFDRALDLVDETLNESEAAADAAHDGDRETMNAKLEESERNSDEANRIANGYGLTDCGG